MKKLLLAVALASTAFAAHADPSFSVSGSTTQPLGPFYDGPALGSAIANIGNLSVVGGPGFITYQYIGAEASFVNMYMGSAALFSTPGVSGTFVNCSSGCTSGPFTVGSGIVPFSFTSGGGFGSIANGANNADTPPIPFFGVILQNSTTAFLLFNDRGAGFDRDFDDMIVKATIAAVPEPSTYAMLLAGLGIMGVMMRRRARG